MRNAMSPAGMTEVVNGKRYNVDAATLLADNAYWDGSNWDRQGRNTWLYRTPKGTYFTVHMTMWTGEHNTIRPITLDEAKQVYEDLRDKALSYEEAFPGVTVEDA